IPARAQRADLCVARGEPRRGSRPRRASLRDTARKPDPANAAVLVSVLPVLGRAGCCVNELPDVDPVSHLCFGRALVAIAHRATPSTTAPAFRRAFTGAI